VYGVTRISLDFSVVACYNRNGKGLIAYGRRVLVRFFKKKAASAEGPPETEARGPDLNMDMDHGVDPGGADQTPAEPVPDYYDWKARYRPWAGLGMIGPVVAGAAVLGLFILILLAFVFHPSW